MPTENGPDSERIKPEQLFQSLHSTAEHVDGNDDVVNTSGATTDNENDNDNQSRDGNGKVVQEIESLCMQCHKNGTTRLLLTQIPFFREIILMSFACPHCGFRNSEVQSAGQIQERGVRYTFAVTEQKDLSNQVIKSEHCTVSLPSVDLEIPPKRGVLTTIEGLISSVVEDLSADQPVRKAVDEETFNKIEDFIGKLKALLDSNSGLFNFDVIVDDPSGNSWIEPSPGQGGDKWKRETYTRSSEQNNALSLEDTSAPDEHETTNDQRDSSSEIVPDEVHVFVDKCPGCSRQCPTKMKPVDIPHFREVVIMSTVCDACGYKSNEVKTGGPVSNQGRRITLHVQDKEDLSRDILKSETCSVHVPELNLDLHQGTLGGRFTTVEGLLAQVHDELYGRVFSEQSDSMDESQRERWTTFLNSLQRAQEGEMKFTLILDDPLSASYLQNLYAPDDDPEMKVEYYDRTREQNDELGLNDMRV